MWCGKLYWDTKIIITSYADICKIIRIHKYYTYRTASGNVSQVCIIIGWFLQLLIKACKLFNSEFPLYSTSLRPHSCVRICQYYQTWVVGKGYHSAGPLPRFQRLLVTWHACMQYNTDLWGYKLIFSMFCLSPRLGPHFIPWIWSWL